MDAGRFLLQEYGIQASEASGHRRTLCPLQNGAHEPETSERVLYPNAENPSVIQFKKVSSPLDLNPNSYYTLILVRIRIIFL